MFPHVFHQVWLDGGSKPLPQALVACRGTAVELHPPAGGWVHRYHTAATVAATLADPAFDAIRGDVTRAWSDFGHGDRRHEGRALQADILRLCALYLEGGVYADHDLYWLRPLDDALLGGVPADGLLLAQFKPHCPGEFLIGAPPRSTAILAVLTEFVRQRPSSCITMDLPAHARYRRWSSLPPAWFCPHPRHCPPAERYRVFPETRAIHLFWREFAYDLGRLAELGQQARLATA